MFEYVCDHIVPGCTIKTQGDTPERAREKAVAHLNEHHGMEYIDAPYPTRSTWPYSPPCSDSPLDNPSCDPLRRR